jgi:hypothetical protein
MKKKGARMTNTTTANPAHQEKMQTARYGARKVCPCCGRESRTIKDGLCGACYAAREGIASGGFPIPANYYTKERTPS